MTAMEVGKHIPWYMKSGQYECHPSCYDHHQDADGISICRLVKQHNEEECTEAEDMYVKLCWIILGSGCE